MRAARYYENAAVVQLLLNAGTDATATNEDDKTAGDLIQGNEALEGTPPYWRLTTYGFSEWRDLSLCG